MSLNSLPDIDWNLVAPEVELQSIVHTASSKSLRRNKAPVEDNHGRMARDASHRTTERSDMDPLPDRFKLLKVFRHGSQVLCDISDERPLTVQDLKDALETGSSEYSRPLQVLWLMRPSPATGHRGALLRDENAPLTSEAQWGRALKWMAEKLNVSPLFFDCVYATHPPIPLAKLSGWPLSSTSNSKQGTTNVLTGVYSIANNNCVWFRHNLPAQKDSQLSSLYIVHITMGKGIDKDFTYTSRFFSRAEYLSRMKSPLRVPPLLEFMAVDLLLSDNTAVTGRINVGYSELTNTLARLDTDSTQSSQRHAKIDTRERQALYETMNKSYKSLGVLATRFGSQKHTIKFMVDLAKAYGFMQNSSEASRRVVALLSYLDNFELSTSIIHSDLESRLQFFSTLMNLHMGTLMQIDSATSMEIAESSKTIAEETGKDSSTMKAIAILTMVFLPSTLVASIFSTPFFDAGDDEKVKAGRNFEMFWIVAAPLTLFVLLIYWAWDAVLRRNRKIRHQRAAALDKRDELPDPTTGQITLGPLRRSLVSRVSPA